MEHYIFAAQIMPKGSLEHEMKTSGNRTAHAVQRTQLHNNETEAFELEKGKRTIKVLKAAKKGFIYECKTFSLFPNCFS